MWQFQTRAVFVSSNALGDLLQHWTWLSIITFMCIRQFQIMSDFESSNAPGDLLHLLPYEGKWMPRKSNRSLLTSPYRSRNNNIRSRTKKNFWATVSPPPPRRRLFGPCEGKCMPRKQWFSCKLRLADSEKTISEHFWAA